MLPSSRVVLTADSLAAMSLFSCSGSSGGSSSKRGNSRPIDSVRAGHHGVQRAGEGQASSYAFRAAWAL